MYGFDSTIIAAAAAEYGVSEERLATYTFEQVEALVGLYENQIGTYYDDSHEHAAAEDMRPEWDLMP